MHVKRIQGHVLSLLLLVSLAACSGEGDTTTPPPATSSATSAEGLWNGTNGTTRRAVTGVVLNDGTYWFLYALENNPDIISGLVQGNSTTPNGTLTSSDARDFSVERQLPPTLDATITGNYTSKQRLDGTISYQNNSQEEFTTTYDGDYELTPNINAVVGTYIGRVTVNATAEITVLSTGEISGKTHTNPECTFTGSFSPRTRGNVFDVTITFDGQSSCLNGSDTVTGVGFFHAGKLYSAALNADRTKGVVFLGTKS